MSNRVAIVGGCRTPFVKAGGAFAKRTFLDLGIHSVVELVKRMELDPTKLDELVFGTVLLDPRLPNWAREVVIRSSLPKSICAHSVSNNCISGLVAANVIAEGLRSGRLKIGIAGGSESMSRPALSVHPKAEKFFIALSKARSLADRLKLLGSFRPSFLLPLPPSPKEPSTGLTMGQHTELIAKEFGITRQEQDAWAASSHQKAAVAQKDGLLAQDIIALDGVEHDNLIRGDTSVEKLAKLTPVFDRSGSGSLTAGNSSALTDGSSAVCLMQEQVAKAEGREILAYFEDIQYAAIAPSDGLLMAPAIALPELLRCNNLSIGDIDIFEIHEAFAAQVLCNMKAWKEGWAKGGAKARAIGEIPLEKINPCGGSIAIGHPFAATGGRLLLSLAHSLKRLNKRVGVISVCAAGGMAAAVLLRREN